MQRTISLDTGASAIVCTTVREPARPFHNPLLLPIALSLAIHAGVGLMLIGQIFATAPPRLLERQITPLHVTWLSAPGVHSIRKTSAPAAVKAPTPAETATPEAPFTPPAIAPTPHLRTASNPAPQSAVVASVPGPAKAAAPASSVRNIAAVPPAALRHAAPDHGPGEAPAVVLPRYRNNDAPPYPIVARLKGYEGIVLIAAQVSSQGRVQTIRIKKSSGYAVLDRSAEEAVKSWRFEPGRQMGVPMAMWVDVPVRFVLRDKLASSDS